MKTEELIERLSAFNEWRRGAEMPQPSPEDIGKWLEWACCVLDEQAKALQSFEVALTSIASLSKTLREERDEAREDLEFRRELYALQTERLQRIERERDEAREQVKELIYIAGRAIDLAEIDFENDKFGVVSELRGGLEKIKEEQKEIDRVNRSWGKSTK